MLIKQGGDVLPREIVPLKTGCGDNVISGEGATSKGWKSAISELVMARREKAARQQFAAEKWRRVLQEASRRIRIRLLKSTRTRAASKTWTKPRGAAGALFTGAQCGNRWEEDKRSHGSL